MSKSVKGYNVDGDLEVNQDIHTGGGVNVNGASHFKDDVKVDGVLFADNINSCNKGIFTSLDKLKSSYDSPKNGWFAFIISEEELTMYIAEDNQWKKSSIVTNNEAIIGFYDSIYDDIQKVKDMLNSQSTLTIHIGFGTDWETASLGDYGCVAGEVSVIGDFPSVPESNSLIIIVPQASTENPYYLEYVASNGINIPVSSFSTDIDGEPSTVYQSMEIISSGKMDNVTLCVK